MDDFVRWLQQLRDSAAGGNDEDLFVTAVVSAILAHLYIAWIHPFGTETGARRD